jgi:hypothetical protein
VGFASALVSLGKFIVGRGKSQGGTTGRSRTTGLRDHVTKGPRDHGTTGPRDYRTTGPPDYGPAGNVEHRTPNIERRTESRLRDHRTTGPRDNGTTGLQDNRTTGPQDHQTKEQRAEGRVDRAIRWLDRVPPHRVLAAPICQIRVIPRFSSILPNSKLLTSSSGSRHSAIKPEKFAKLRGQSGSAAP